MPQHYPTELDPLVGAFEHQSTRPRADEALQILKKVASMVKPIMRLRNWRVGTLAEFFPPDGSLLGLNTNRGWKIQLRLRYAGDETQFMPFENIIDTMLHELCHNVHGPHDQAFNALWDKLRDEHEALVRKGYTGEGFLGKGNRVGGRRIPREELNRQARAAAERRRQVASLGEGSGRVLGGQGIVRGQNAREVIASAAERRHRVEQGCASAAPERTRMFLQEQATKGRPTTITQADRVDEEDAAMMQAYIDMIQEEEAQIFGTGYVPPSQANPTGGVRQGKTSVPPVRNRSLVEEQHEIERQLQQQSRVDTKPKPPTTSSPRPTPPPLPVDDDTWTCEICTLINPMRHLMCGACETERPASYSTATTKPRPDRDAFGRPTTKFPPPRTSTSTATTARARADPSSASSNSTPAPARHTALQPRLSSTASISRIQSQANAKVQSTPVGWECRGCHNWMESQWWTCSVCGRMKESS